jgi:rubrerythrin
MPEVRLIDANAAADKIMREIETHADEIGIGATAILIAFARALRDETDFPTIKPEVRQGRWIQRRNGQYYCNNCGREERFIFQKNFCPKCGAKMGGGADN